jgi:hypothetical protein
MGIKKKVIPAVVELSYECDVKGCTKSGENESDFAIDVPVVFGKAKDKVVMCDDHKTEHDQFMTRYFDDDVDPEEVEGVKIPDDYDPQTYPQMQKLAPADRDRHYKAKVWALGPDSTMAKSNRPGGVKGLAGDKVLAAYDAWLAEEKAKADEIRRKVAEIEAEQAALQAKT